jgi:hypothetical protein
MTINKVKEATPHKMTNKKLTNDMPTACTNENNPSTYNAPKVKHTPGLWKHQTRPIRFTLVVDDFGVKYCGEDNFEHLVKAQKTLWHYN